MRLIHLRILEMRVNLITKANPTGTLPHIFLNHAHKPTHGFVTSEDIKLTRHSFSEGERWA